MVGGFLADPVSTIELTMLAFAVFFTLLGVTALIFRKAGAGRAMALGLMVSQRNMGLMLAATDGMLPGTTWLYFALSQFPIYLSPQLLKPIVRKLSAATRGVCRTRGRRRVRSVGAGDKLAISRRVGQRRAGQR